jgi:hypothetical protein
LQRLQEVFQKMPLVAVKYFVVDNGRINEIWTRWKNHAIPTNKV